jgi:hypothetical protein
VNTRSTLSVSAAHIATVRGFLPPKGMTSIADETTKPKEAAALHAALDALAARIDTLTGALEHIEAVATLEPTCGARKIRRVARAALADAKKTKA